MNGMSEQEIMDELGVAPIEEDTGEEEKDVADPSDTEDPEGEEEKDVADPSYDKNSEHDAIYASARRRAEEAAGKKIKEAEKKASERIKKVIASLGVKNPITGKIAETEEELTEARAAERNSETQSKLKRLGISEDFIKDIISEHPAVKEAEALSAKLKAEQERADNAEYSAQISKEIEKISDMNPNIKTFDDIYALPEYEAIYNYSVKKGLSLSEAYTLATHSKSIENARAAARAQAKNETGSKSHLKTSRGGKGNLGEVPADVLARMKELTPGLSDDKYREFYLKQKGK